MNIKKGCLAVICLGSFCMPAYALDWLINPQLDVTERYTDNLRLLIGSHHPGNLITTLSPSLVLGYIEDNEDFQANLRWNQLLYHDDPNIDFSEKDTVRKLNLTDGEIYAGDAVNQFKETKPFKFAGPVKQ